MGKRGELRGMGRTLIWTICLLLGLNTLQAERATWECADDITDEDNCMECDRVRDSLALVALYNSTDGPNWTITWDLSQPMDTWFGIELNDDGCVTRIDLDGNPDQVCCDSITGNNLVGTWPEMNLPELKTIDFRSNFIEGPIPDLSSLPKLKFLDVMKNNLSGSIGPQIASNIELTHLWISSNPNINGALPIELIGLPNFESFLGWRCGFEGELPEAYGQMSQLKTLMVGYNNLTGVIPNSYQNMVNLDWFWVENNNLSGDIPSFMFDLPLTSFVVDRNEFTIDGSIVDKVKDNDWQRFFVIHNRITFENLIEAIDVIEDRIAIFGTNTTTHQLRYSPQDSIYFESFITTTSGESIIIDLEIDEGLSSNIYQWYKDDTPYTVIEGNNNLEFKNIRTSDSGVYRAEVTNPLVPDLTLYSRDITINVEPTCRERDSLELVRFYNHFNGSNWTFNPSQEYWNYIGGEVELVPNAGNPWLIGPVNTWHGVELNANGCLDRLILESMNLTGTFDQFTFDEMDGIYLNNNNITGGLIDFQWPSLRVFQLNNNFNLGGQLIDFSGMPSLLSLILNNNNIEGDLIDFTGFNLLKEIQLGGNNLSGPIPTFENNPSLGQLYLPSNDLSGEIPIELGNLLENQLIDLSHNNLSGEIPTQLGNATNLRVLNLNYNGLVGAVPSELAQLINLTQLRLNNNYLSGCIPGELFGLCFLTTDGLRQGIESCQGELQGCQYDFRNNPLLPWQGDFARFCAGEDQIGAPCDDGDPNTTDDKINADCECKGCAIVRIEISGSEVLCEGEIGMLSVSGGPYDNYEWSNGSNDPSATIEAPGVYSVIISDENGCTAMAEYTVGSSIDDIDIEGPDELCPDEEATLFLADDYRSYDWSEFGDDPTATIIGPGVYRVELMDDAGCRYLGEIEIQMTEDCKDPNVVEKVITPNGDGRNDQFDTGIENLAADFPRNELLVFNRWGAIVYQAQPYDNDWTGQNNNGQPLPEATYYVLFKQNGNNNFSFRGSVTVIR